MRGLWTSAMTGLLLVSSVLGCNADEAASSASEPLRRIDIPRDFTFSMTQGVDVHVRPDAALSLHAPLEVQVSLPDGARLYRGPIVAGVPRRVEVIAPTATDQLLVQLTGRAKTIEQRIRIEGGAAQVDLR